MSDSSSPPAPIPVLFLGGYGRSGSSIMELLLSQVEGVAVMGEVRHLFGRVMIDDELCNCGVPVLDCPHWTHVLRTSFPFGFDQPELDRVHRRLNRLAAVPALRWQRLRTPSFRRDLDLYCESLERVFRAHRDASDARLVVDVSKYPVHGMALLARPDLFELSTVLLVRDPRAVANSWENPKARPEIHWEERLMPRHPAFRSALAWNVSNRLTLALRRSGGPFSVVRYEDFVDAPLDTLNSMLESTGLDLPDATDEVFDVRAVKQVHKLSGNPLGLEGERIEIAPGESWRGRLGRWPQLVVTALCIPQMRRFGYL